MEPRCHGDAVEAERLCAVPRKDKEVRLFENGSQPLTCIGGRLSLTTQSRAYAPGIAGDSLFTQCSDMESSKHRSAAGAANEPQPNPSFGRLGPGAAKALLQRLL